MRTDRFIIPIVRRLLIVAAFSAGIAGAQSVPAPLIDIQSNGNFVVSYHPCSSCSGHGIEEFRNQSSSWVYVGSGDVSIVNRSPGTYRYRVVYYLYFSHSGYHPAYGPEVSVVVDESGQTDLPTQPSLPLQLNAEYSISSGHIDGDGNRDILIRRLSQYPEGGAGTMGDVLLRQTDQGVLEPSTPDQWELSIASSWPSANVEVQNRDVNIDGYADLLLRGLAHADGFEQIDNQILFAPGADLSGQPPEVLAVNDRLALFSRDVDRHLIDPDYYPENAPMKYAVVVYYTLNCSSYGYGYSSYYDGFNPWPCAIEPRYLYIVYQDFSVFDQDAMEIASSDYGMIHGVESTETGMQNIASTLARVLGIGIGGWDINELLGETEGVSNEEERRGMELFAVLAALSEVVEEEGEEQDPTPDSERVLIKGRRVLGQGPFHTAVEFRGSTVSAYDSDSRMLFDGNLVSEVNWPRDHPSLTLRMGFVDGPGAPSIYWSTILLADSRYADDLRYDLFPSLGEGGYNSNSFISGLVQATVGRPTIQLESFVGAERPVPVSAFN